MAARLDREQLYGIWWYNRLRVRTRQVSEPSENGRRYRREARFSVKPKENTTGCSITGGAFYNPTTVQFPVGYVGDYFFADFCSGWIRILEPTPGGGFAARGFATGIERPVDLEVSEAGELHYLARGSTGTPASVRKIRYAGI